jgi:hypothetical protein
MNNSPWGPVQQQDNFCPGVTRVSTAGHGGFAIAEGFAHKHLSEAARSRAGFKNSGYYWYEEDCDWAIPVYELPDLWPEVFRWMPQGSAAEYEKYLIESLSCWNADYLLVRGITPDPVCYARYLEMQERWKGQKVTA